MILNFIYDLRIVYELEIIILALGLVQRLSPS